MKWPLTTTEARVRQHFSVKNQYQKWTIIFAQMLKSKANAWQRLGTGFVLSIKLISHSILKNRPSSASFSLIFIFSNKHQCIIYDKSMWKKSCPSCIRAWDSNPQPFKHESSPITTRPGLPPYFFDIWPFKTMKICPIA